IMTTLVMIAFLFFGLVAYTSLPVSDLPNVDFPTISVSASLPGASPDTMASAVATPLEKQFSTIAGVDQMTSSNTLGSTQITLQFALDRNLDAAAQDVQSMIAKASRDLPQDMPAPPSYQKVNPADSPILYMAVSSPTMRLSDVDEYAETTIAQTISQVSGVAQVSVFGAQKYAVRAQLDPRKMASAQVGIDEVAAAVQKGNVNMPTGTLWGSKQAFTVQANGQLMKADQYRPLIVAYRNGNPIRLEQIANVFDSVENDKNAAWFAGENHQLNRAMVLAVQRQPGTNTVEVVDNIRKLLPGFRQQMPAAVNLDIMYDRSKSIRESVDDVKFTLYLSLVLVILVIFLFLRNLSATLIPSLALPFSIIATFAVMYQLGYSLDNLSLMALTLSVGFVVDDAIVMLENIVRHIEMGEGPMQAALRGSREIGFTIISMTLSLAAVFLPVLFMGGILGRLLHEFAVTIGVAILVSGFVSLSLTPMMCSRILRSTGHGKEVKHGRFYMALERFFDGLLKVYDHSLQFVMRHSLATAVLFFVLIGLTVQLYRTMPTGFLPSEDQGQIYAMTEGAQGMAFNDLVAHQVAVSQAVLNSPEGKYINSFFSIAGRGASNAGMFVMRFIPRSERPHVDDIAQSLRPVVAKIPGLSVYMQNPPPIRIGGQLTKSQYAYTLQSPDTKELYAAAPKLEQALREVPGLQDVTSDLQMKNPQVNIDIDRDKAAALGLSAQQVEDALYTAYGSRQISTIYAPNNAYRVIMELQPQFQMDPSTLSLLYVRSTGATQAQQPVSTADDNSSSSSKMSSGSNMVPLSTVAKITKSLGPMSINHLGQLPAVTISFNLKPGVALGDAVTAVNQTARKVLPGTITTSFQGAAQAFESSKKGLGLLLAMAIAVIYIVLGILYESFIHPITILSGLPAAGLGALLTLKLFHIDLNLYAFVGIIMLVGIVKKNAIMMIDFALEAERGGQRPEEAIYHGALIRFRPIMMTTMAALMGTLPIALGFGAGAESRRPLGLAVVGGLMVSQLLTLYITPVVYIYMERFMGFFRRHFGKAKGKEAQRHQQEPVLAD
ncbi:MAG TPA: efflux RND transporter permease subunit, partial [Terriglobales bacterium]|nr:efflux RND transporter permease subunit [Terriglobales bacterium]